PRIQSVLLGSGLRPMTDSLVREYERAIDAGYKTLPIFSLPLADAAYGILSAFDSHILTEKIVKERRGEQSLSLGQIQVFKLLGEGFSLAMRWLLRGNYRVDARPEASEDSVIAGAALVDYGQKYYRASMLYSGYSQGRMDAEVDPERRLARFSHKASVISDRPTWAFAEGATNQMSRKTPRWKRLRDQLQEASARVFQQVPHHLEQGRIVLDDIAHLRHESVGKYVEWITADQRLFSPEIDLGGFTVREFESYWRAIYTWSVCATHLYCCYCDQGRLPQEQYMPTQVVPINEFLDSIGTLSSLSRDVAALITYRLKVDNR